MAGVGKKLLSLFVNYEDEPEKEKSKTEQTPVADKNPVPTIPVNVTSGKSDETIAENLADALEKANLEGFDYFEYAKTIEALRASIPAEQTLYQTAFASAAVMKANKGILLSSAQHYIDVLNEEANKFSSLVETEIQDNVKKKENQIEEIDKGINEKVQQIQVLTEEINKLSNEKTSIVNEVSENRIKIEKIQNDFAATLQIFLEKIQKDVEKIQKYIVG